MRIPWRISSFPASDPWPQRQFWKDLYCNAAAEHPAAAGDLPQDIQVMEDILENHSLTIYHLEKGYAFARLTAASSGLQPAPARSLAVDKYIDVFRAIEQDGVWVNRTFAPDLPCMQPVYARTVSIRSAQSACGQPGKTR